MATEDKMFDLLEKLYIEMQSGFTAVRAEMKDGLDSVRTEMKDGLDAVRNEMHQGLSSVRSEMQEGLSSVRSEMHEGLDSVRGEIGSVRSEMQEGFEKTNQRFVKLEDKLDINLKALYDGYSQNTKEITRLNRTVSNLSEKIESHDLQIIEVGNAK